jgi:hypothetical protein
VAERLSPQHSRTSVSPVINVTIGRIEVRGRRETLAQPVRAESRARVMSLQQYLDRRAAGGGR